MDLPAELRDQVYEQLASTMDLRRLLLVSKQIHTEAGACFYKSTRFFLTIQADSTRNYNLSAGNHTLRVSDAPLEAPGLVEVIQLCQHLFAHIRHLIIRVAFGYEIFARSDGIIMFGCQSRSVLYLRFLCFCAKDTLARG